MRCRSTYRTAGVSAVSATTWCAAQTLSNSVRMASGSGFAGLQPGHAGSQLRADLLDRVIQISLEQLRILAAPTFVLGNPLTRKLALLNLGQNLAHLLLGGLVDHAGSAGQVAVLGRLADEAVHFGDAALMQQIDDQLQFMQAFVVRHRGLVSGLDQGFVTL